MKWAISLVLDNKATIENRIKKVLEYLFDRFDDYSCYLLDIDATGKTGNKFTQELNLKKGGISIKKEDLVKIFSEDGQVFELNLTINKSNYQEFRFIIRDGNLVEILGDKELPSEDIIGKFQNIDVNLFKK